MRVLILGATGMLGHALLQHWGKAGNTSPYVLAATCRGNPPAALQSLIGGVSIYPAEANDLASVERAIVDFKPQAVINAIGVIKQKDGAADAETTISINSLFPHQLHRLCREAGARLVHLSTDCVFSGRKGQPYTEADLPDAVDLYGRSKLLGEIAGEGALTLRTSIIGRELGTQVSLLEWALSQRGKKIKGYAGALYSGFTTVEMARIIGLVLRLHPALSGIYHVASAAISKYALLQLINEHFRIDLSIEKEEFFKMDRRLDSSRFEAATGYIPPSWGTMIEELAVP